MKGFIKDYRQEINSNIWMMPPLYHRVWQYLKYMANHQDNVIPMRDGSSMTIKKGQHLHSVRGIAQGVAWYEGAKWKEPNPKTISSILDWLEKNDMISIERGQGNRQYTLITLLNWDLYQQKEIQGNSKETPNGEAGKQQTDINKNELKNEKNEKKKKTSRHKYEICDYEAAELLFNKMLINNPKVKAPDLEQWANEVRLMREQDKRTIEEITNLIIWTQQDPFWKANILSTPTLRKKFDQLSLKCKEDKHQNHFNPKDVKQVGNRNPDYSKYNFYKEREPKF